MEAWILSPHSRVNVVRFTEIDDLARATLGMLTAPTVALSGGTTFATLFPAWVKLNPDCSHTRFFPVDERVVPFETPQSNWGVAYRLFLRAVGRDEDKANHPTSAEAYRMRLEATFAGREIRFDTILLGVGDDGHTASLFPGDPAVDDLASSVLATRSPKPPTNRITLGSSVLTAARSLAVLAAGEHKAPIVARIRSVDLTLPIVKILSRRSESTLFVHDALLPS